jgi:hypothetical protein
MAHGAHGSATRGTHRATEETKEIEDLDAGGQDRRLHAAVRAHMADIKGWTQLPIREGNQPTLDVARMTLIAHRIEASICALKHEHRQQGRRHEGDPVVWPMPARRGSNACMSPSEVGRRGGCASGQLRCQAQCQPALSQVTVASQNPQNARV